MKYSKICDYIFGFIIKHNNIDIINFKNKEIDEFMAKSYTIYDSCQGINIFDQQTLLMYDQSIRLIAHVIFEKLPTEYNIELADTQTYDDIINWLSTLAIEDYILILYTLNNLKLIDISTDEKLSYMLNIYLTIEPTTVAVATEQDMGN